MSADFSSNQKNVRAAKQIQRNVLLKYIWVWLFWEYLYLLSNNARQCKSHFWHFSPGKFWHPAEKATRLQAECIPLWQEGAPQQNVRQKHFNSTGGDSAIRANVWQPSMLHYKHFTLPVLQKLAQICLLYIGVFLYIFWQNFLTGQKLWQCPKWYRGKLI